MLYFCEDFCNTFETTASQDLRIHPSSQTSELFDVTHCCLRCNLAWQTQPSRTFVSLLLFGYRPAENVSVRSDPCEILATLIHLCLLPIQSGVNGFLSIGRLAKHIALLHVCTDDRVPLREKKNKKKQNTQFNFRINFIVQRLQLHFFSWTWYHGHLKYTENNNTDEEKKGSHKATAATELLSDGCWSLSPATV